MKVYISHKFTFDSAHCLPGYAGPCSNLHGHTYHGEVTISCYEIDIENGMVLDYQELKRIVQKEIIDVLDHKDINPIINFYSTAENICLYLFPKIGEELPKHIKLERVSISETPNSNAWVQAN